ncbi:MAG: hypothetical protein HY328_09520 [Chloroflexi bacterium]|nr:hypothetical protein [Chloroflexota bacterium]
MLRNTPPARIFMGDVGSTLLGYTLAALPVLAFLQTGDARLFLVGILCVAPFVLDPSYAQVKSIRISPISSAAKLLHEARG